MLKASDMWDMPLGSGSEGEIPHWSGNVLYAIFAFLCKVLWRYRIDNRESLRALKGHGAVVISPHTSFLDVVIIYLSARTSQWIRLMGRDTLFDNAGGLMGLILSCVGAFPVKRDSADRTAIKRASAMLKRGELVGILPEGTRRGKGTAKIQIHSGAAFIAKMGKAPILPMCVRNCEYVKQKGKFLRFPKITAEFGTPILLEDFDFLPKQDRIEAWAWYSMRECFALKDNIPAEEVDMRALFPDDRDFTEVFQGRDMPKRTSAEWVASLEKSNELAGE